MVTFMGIIYCAENQINGKCYIGMTTQGLKVRKIEHKSNAKNKKWSMYFHKALRKHGFNNFNWEIIDEHDDIEVLKQLERLHIARYESMNPQLGYNLTPGGDFLSGEEHLMYGKKLAPEAREKISKNNKKRKISLKTRRKHQKNNKSWHDFPGAHYYNRKAKPWLRVWNAKITYKGKQKYLGCYNDPLSASMVYEFVLNEIYGEE